MALDVNEKTFTEETSTGLVLVDFWAPWCGPCRMLGPVLEQLENVKVVKVNVDENQQLAVQHGVSSIPKLVLLKDGASVWEATGLQSKDVIQGKVDQVLNE